MASETERRSSDLEREGQKIDVSMLSYSEMTLVSSGEVMTRETKAAIRKKLGYCTECPGRPVLVFDVKRSKLNPLWFSKKVRSIDGECNDGHCLKCHPDFDPKKPSERRALRRYSEKSCGTNSTVSMGSSRSLRSQDSDSSSPNTPVRTTPRPKTRALARSLSNETDLQAIKRMPRLDSKRIMENSDSASDERHNDQRANRQHSDGRPMPRRSKSANLSPETSPNSGDSGEGQNMTLRGNSEHLRSSTSHHEGRLTVELSRKVVDTLYNDDIKEASVHSFSTVERSESSPPASPSDNWSPTPSPRPRRKIKQQDLQSSAVTELQGLLVDLVSSGSHHVLSEILCDSMKSNSNDLEIQLLCLRTISSAFKQSNAGISKLVLARAHIEIINAMQHFHSSMEIQQRACAAIWALSRDNSARTALIRKGVCDLIQRAMSRNFGDNVLVEKALMALRALSIDEEARDILHRVSVVHDIVQVMECHCMNADIQRDGCAVLSNMAVEFEKKQASVVSVHVLRAVVAALKTHLSDPVVVESACFALNNFSYEETNLRALRRFTEIFPLLERAQQISKGDHAFAVVEKLQISRAEDESLEEQLHAYLLHLIEQKADVPEVVEEVVEFLRANEWSLRMMAETLSALRLLATKATSHKEILLDQLSIPDLERILRVFEDDIRIQTEARRLIECFK